MSKFESMKIIDMLACVWFEAMTASGDDGVVLRAPYHDRPVGNPNTKPLSLYRYRFTEQFQRKLLFDREPPRAAPGARCSDLILPGGLISFDHAP